METHSKNPTAAVVVGMRSIGKGVIPFDEPFGVGLTCPKCSKIKARADLQWSEYNGFCWCSTCNFDYPSVLCHSDPQKATEFYLQAVVDAVTLHVNGILKHIPNKK